tara:strand:- start:3825 stop:4592 length:768 start_codon:yes stop_codon:yes gene_type:complete
MITLNTAESRLIDRHPVIKTRLDFDKFTLIMSELEDVEKTTFQLRIELATWLVKAEKALNSSQVQNALNDMEISWNKEDVMRIFGISASWYYRLKKAGANYTVANRNAFTRAKDRANYNGVRVSDTIDNFNIVCNAKAKLLKDCNEADSNITEWTQIPLRQRDECINNSFISSNAPSPEDVSDEIAVARNTNRGHFLIDVKYNGYKFSVKINPSGEIYEINPGNVTLTQTELHQLVTSRFTNFTIPNSLTVTARQ